MLWLSWITNYWMYRPIWVSVNRSLGFLFLPDRRNTQCGLGCCSPSDSRLDVCCFQRCSPYFDCNMFFFELLLPFCDRTTPALLLQFLPWRFFCSCEPCVPRAAGWSIIFLFWESGSCLFLCQRAAEGSPVLLRPWRGWRAEQPARPHHNAGSRLPSGPGRRPLSRAPERGSSPLTGRLIPPHDRVDFTITQLCPLKHFHFCSFFLDLWADPDLMPQGAFWVPIHADRSELV